MNDHQDVAQFKKDTQTHPLTSKQSLRQLARSLSVMNNSYVTDRLYELESWLDAYGDELPSERFNSTAEANGMDDAGFANAWVDSPEYFDDDTDVGKAPTAAIAGVNHADWGILNVAGKNCYKTLPEALSFMISNNKLNAEQTLEALAGGPYSETTSHLVQGWRTEQYARHRATQDAVLRWRGMDEFSAVTRLIELQEAGVKFHLPTVQSKPLPPRTVVLSLFCYDPSTGAFTHRAARRGVRAGTSATRLDSKGLAISRVGGAGARFYTARLAWLYVSGVDPLDSPVRFIDGDPSNLRLDNLTVAPVGLELYLAGHQWRLRVRAQGRRFEIGRYDKHETGVEAAALFRRAYERFGSNSGL